MLEEKWYKPKPVEQLIREDKTKQFNIWVKNKCIEIIDAVTHNTCLYLKHKEVDGYMRIECMTEDNHFYYTYIVNINDFWDKDDISKMYIDLL